MKSYELGQKWPNGIRLVYRQQFPCGHFVPVWSNHEGPAVLREPDWHVDPALKRRVLDAGCIKCEPPAEPIPWRHRGVGGFLKNYVERV